MSINWNIKENEALVEQSEIRSSVATLASFVNLLAKEEAEGLRKLSKIEYDETKNQCRVYYLVNTESY